MRKYIIILVSLFVLFACESTYDKKNNPLFSSGVIDASMVKLEHFEPALKEAIKLHDAEIKKIAKVKQIANYANTVGALESSGEMLRRLVVVLDSMPRNSAELTEFYRGLDDRVEEHYAKIYANKILAPRVATVYAANIQNNSSYCGPNRVCSVIKAAYEAKPEKLTQEQKAKLMWYYNRFFPSENRFEEVKVDSLSAVVDTLMN